jgi:hypothetical protein
VEFWVLQIRSSRFWLLRENEFCRRKGDMKSGIIVGLEVQ